MNKHDTILDGITVGEIALTLKCNEPVINEKTVNKVFDEILAFKLEDARFFLQKHKHEIVKMAQNGGE